MAAERQEAGQASGADLCLLDFDLALTSAYKELEQHRKEQDWLAVNEALVLYKVLGDRVAIVVPTGHDQQPRYSRRPKTNDDVLLTVSVGSDLGRAIHMANLGRRILLRRGSLNEFGLINAVGKAAAQWEAEWGKRR